MQLYGPYSVATDARRCFVLDCSPEPPDASTCLVAIIAHDVPSDRIQAAVARHAATLTAQSKRSTQTPQVYLCRIDRGSSAAELQLLPYWTPLPVDLNRLASDALESTAQWVERLGRFHFDIVGGQLQVVAWRGRFAGATCAIYEIGQDREFESGADIEEFYFYFLMSRIAASRRGWERISTWRVINRADASEPLLLDVLAVDVPAAVEPRRLAEAMVERESFVVIKDGVGHYTAAGGANAGLTAIFPDDSGPPLMVFSGAGRPVDPAKMARLRVLSDLHGRSYLPAAEQCLAEGDFEAAYGYYMNHLRLANFEAGPSSVAGVADVLLPHDPRRAVEAGLALTRQMLADGAIDFAEGIASAASKFARSWGYDRLAVQLLSLAGAAATTLGRFGEAQDRLGDVLRVAGLTVGVDPRLHADLYWQLAKCLIWKHLGFESAHRTMAPPNLNADLAAAEAALVEASRRYKQAAIIDLPVAAAIVTIYQARIDDLRGEHARALVTLRNLRGRPHVRQHPGLRSAAMLFEALALCKLHRAEPDWWEQYATSLLQFVDEAFGVPGAVVIEPPMLAVGLTLAAEELIARGDTEAAVVASAHAHLIQEAVASAQIRAPEPDLQADGWLGIPMLDRLQAALHRHALGSGGDRALTAAIEDREAAKSRWFQRDFGLRLLTSGHTPTIVRDMEKDLRRAYMNSDTDPRELYASIRLLQIQEGLPPVRRGHDAAKSFDPAALTNLPLKTAFVSLYAGREQTYASVIRGRREPELLGMSIEFSSERLQRLAGRLQTYLSGTGLYPPIDPRNPWQRHDRYLAELDHLQELAQPLAAALRGMELVVLSPHSYWHQIPLHALLAMHLREVEVTPGFTHVPTLALLPELHAASTTSDLDIVNAAVFTAPGPRDSIDEFARCHDRIAHSLIGAGLPTREAVGADATEAAFALQYRTAGLQHVIAHGCFRPGRQVMQSGLLLPGRHDQTVPGDEQPIMTAWQIANLTTGVRHLTLQACSLGRSLIASADEQWGVTRGALAAGIPSVLAPMWSIDLLSSSFTSERFYEYWLGRSIPKWTALAMAQHDTFAADPSWAHPYHWAAFKLVGL